jgi:hypothetical protein
MKKIPANFNGYYRLTEGRIQEGDLLEAEGKPFEFTEGLIGLPCERFAYPIYRKIEADEESDQAKTDDSGKPPLACLPWAALKEVSMVQAYGQEKYGDIYDYRKGMKVTRPASCALRHIAAWIEGEDLDNESKLNHLAHAVTRLLFILQNLNDGTAIDDRPETIK